MQKKITQVVPKIDWPQKSRSTKVMFAKIAVKVGKTSSHKVYQTYPKPIDLSRFFSLEHS
jgi:hypothetical protein